MRVRLGVKGYGRLEGRAERSCDPGRQYVFLSNGSTIRQSASLCARRTQSLSTYTSCKYSCSRLTVRLRSRKNFELIDHVEWGRLGIGSYRITATRNGNANCQELFKGAKPRAVLKYRGYMESGV